MCQKTLSSEWDPGLSSKWEMGCCNSKVSNQNGKGYLVVNVEIVMKFLSVESRHQQDTPTILMANQNEGVVKLCTSNRVDQWFVRAVVDWKSKKSELLDMIL